MKNFISKSALVFTILSVQSIFAQTFFERLKNWWNNISLQSTKLSFTNKAANASSWAQTNLQAVPTKYKVSSAALVAGTGALGIWYWVRQRKNTPKSNNTPPLKKNESEGSKEVKTSTKTEDTFIVKGITYKIGDKVTLKYGRTGTIASYTETALRLKEYNDIFTPDMIVKKSND